MKNLAALLLAVAACGGGPPAVTYEAQQLQCIDRAPTRAEADVCRCRVKASFARPCDGGAP